MGFRIIDSVTNVNPSLLKSFARFILKVVLGTVSLLWAFFDRREQFFHDNMTHSMAIMCDIPADQVEALETGSTSQTAEDDRLFAMPSLKRRVIFTLLYAFAVFVLFSIAIATIFPDCSEERPASPEQCYIIEAITGGLLLLLLMSIMGVGLKGGLPGARKCRISTES